MLKNIWNIIKVELPIFGAIVAINGLYGGSIIKWVNSLGIATEIAIMIYFTAPTAAYLAGEAIIRLTFWVLRKGKKFYIRRRTEVLFGRVLSDNTVITAIQQAEKRGVISEQKARNLERTISTLEPECLYILRVLDNPTSWAKSHNIELPDWEKAKRYELIKFAVPTLKTDVDWKPYAEKLHQHGLLTLSPVELEVSVSRNQLLNSITSKVGHELVSIIEKYDPYA